MPRAILSTLLILALNYFAQPYNANTIIIILILFRIHTLNYLLHYQLFQRIPLKPWEE